MTKNELENLTAYFNKIFDNSNLSVRPYPKRGDAAELYKGEEFLGIIYKDEEDGELSYNFSMAILDIDLNS